MLKVWGGTMIDWKRSKGPHHGQVRVIVAAPSGKEAARLLGITYGHLRGFWSVTGNKDEIAAAMSQPGIVFKSSSLATRDFEPSH